MRGSKTPTEVFKHTLNQCGSHSAVGPGRLLRHQLERAAKGHFFARLQLTGSCGVGLFLPGRRGTRPTASTAIGCPSPVALPGAGSWSTRCFSLPSVPPVATLKLRCLEDHRPMPYRETTVEMLRSTEVFPSDWLPRAEHRTARHDEGPIAVPIRWVNTTTGTGSRRACLLFLFAVVSPCCLFHRLSIATIEYENNASLAREPSKSHRLCTRWCTIGHAVFDQWC